MIYLINNNNNRLITDVWFTFVIDKVQIYLDDIYLGEYYNESSSADYLVVSIPGEQLQTLNLENKEYTMKLYKDHALFKQEMLTITSNNNLEIYGFTPASTKIEFYERK